MKNSKKREADNLYKAADTCAPFSLLVRLNNLAEPQLYLVPFLACSKSPSREEFRRVGDELATNDDLIRAFEKLALKPSLQELHSVPVPMQQSGISQPSRYALRRALELSQTATLGSQSRSDRLRLTRRFAKWVQARDKGHPAPCVLPCARLSGTNGYETWLSLAVIFRQSPDLLISESRTLLSGVIPFFELLESLYEKGELEVLSGVEVAAGIYAPIIQREGYLTASSAAGSAAALRRIYGAERGNHWHLNALARASSNRLEKFNALLQDEPRFILERLANHQLRNPFSSSMRSHFLKLRVGHLKDLNSMWLALPHLTSPEHLSVFWQAVRSIEKNLASGQYRYFNEPPEWFLIRSIFVSAIAIAKNVPSDAGAEGMAAPMRWIKNREVPSITHEFCKEHLPTAHVGEAVLLSRQPQTHANSAPDHAIRVGVQVAASNPEEELLPKQKSEKSLSRENKKYIPHAELSLAHGKHLSLSQNAVYPRGKLMLLLQTQQLTLGLPQVFANPSALRQGEALVEPHWISKHLEPRHDVLKEIEKSEVNQDQVTLEQLQEELPLPGLIPTSLNRMRSCIPLPEKVTLVTELDHKEAKVSLSYVPLFRGASFQEEASFDPQDLSSILDHLIEKLKDRRRVTRDDVEHSEEPSGFEDIFEALNDLSLEPRFEFEVGEEVFSQDEWEHAEETAHGYLIGERIFLSREEYESCLNVYVLRKKALARFGTIRISNLWPAMDLSRLDGKEAVDPLEYVRHLKLNLEPLLNLVNTSLPKRVLDEINCPGTVLFEAMNSMRAQLRGYQLYGVAWILSRLGCRLGALLADDMGLGKTLQAISTVALRYARDQSMKRPHLPTLVLCPKSLLPNWRHEFQKFLPNPKKKTLLSSLVVGQFEGEEIPENADVVITSYSRFRKRSAELESSYPQWGLVILDEAHAIKNSDTKLATLVGQLKTEGRLALTGTPIENHPRELWSLMDWLNPGVLGKESAFEIYTRMARTGEDKALMLKPVHEVLRPLLLRRMKSDPSIGLELPEKIEQVRYISFTEEQSILYETVVLAAIDADVGASTPFQSHARYLTAITRLKQICNHPELFYAGNEDESILEDEESVGHIGLKHLRSQVARKLRSEAAASRKSWIERSAKMQAFAETLNELQDNPAGVLIFTQFRRSAEQAEKLLKELRWNQVGVLHGGLNTQKRQEMISQFQEACQRRKSEAKSKGTVGRPPALILSLKAGGVGLNLNGGNHVIHLDRWWNPAVEDQATDRAHRIGQDEKVIVTHFCSEGTIEEGIQHRLDSKRQLAADLIGMGSQDSLHDSLKDLKGFLKLVDPYGRFRGRRQIHRSAPSVSRGAQGATRPVQTQEIAFKQLPQSKQAKERELQ